MVVSHEAPPTVRRVVLVDFDWDDADLVPLLLRRPELSVRLVVGQRPEDSGLRLAELCGLPRTLDLADLTREIFELALVSSRSPRRAHVENLLQAMGTQTQSPEGFLGGPPQPAEDSFDLQAALRLQASVVDALLGESESARFAIPAEPDTGPAVPWDAVLAPGWLSPREFLEVVEGAAERHRVSGTAFALDRLDLPALGAAADRFAVGLPARMRRTDSLCRPAPDRVLLFSGTPRARFPFLRSRWHELWEEAWLAAGNERPIPAPLDRCALLTRVQEIDGFLARARLWSEVFTAPS